MHKITPTLWFGGDAEDAVDLYTDVFEGSSIGSTTRYDAASAEASGQPEGSVLTIEFELAGQPFMALNGGPQFPFTSAISFMVHCSTESEVDDLWAALSVDGEVMMPLDAYPFSDRYGWTADRFGVSWQVILAAERPEQTIVPSLMFVGERAGQAEEAIAFYTTVFDDTTVGEIARYGPDQAPDEVGTIMYADVTLAGTTFAAMDSALDHAFDFNESISFVVDCTNQEEVDYYWETLTADGGAAGQCGWLTDKFGISWQVVPTVFTELLADKDDERAGRVMETMLEMGKLEIASLEAAYAG